MTERVEKRIKEVLSFIEYSGESLKLDQLEKLLKEKKVYDLVEEDFQMWKKDPAAFAFESKEPHGRELEFSHYIWEYLKRKL
ncbi:MAG: hypothetical protein M1587_04975, partial [Thaumarchaeota archaeon]|nr:hypothetical protein [Nitrososphaerota archaeon]